MNTERATVIGRIERPSDVAEAVKLLEIFGSPKSKIENDEFYNKRKINTVSYDEFRVRY
jgi:hypothetical protein